MTKRLNESVILASNCLILDIMLELAATVDVHRYTAHSPLLLPVVHEMHAGNGEGNHCCCHVLPCVLPAVSCTFFIVVFEESHQLRLVPYVGHQMSLDLADVKLFQTIVQRLIIREIEPKCMQLVLTIPVALSNKNKPRVFFLGTLDSVRPELSIRTLIGLGVEPAAPGFLKNIFTNEHCHVTPYAIGKGSHLAEHLAHFAARLWVSIVDLHSILPTVVIHVFAVRKHFVADFEKVLRLLLLTLL
mmetsp:Transcript_18991/g.30272  ORF Transcript_18991/g.30272 Transcript_18991/m.30272 type:complete len:245 (-) Transcript_18991:558-1292(-)